MIFHNKSQPHPRTAPSGNGRSGFYTYKGSKPLPKPRS